MTMKRIKQFVLTVLIVLIGVCAFDFAFGIIAGKMLSKISNQGEFCKTYYALNEVECPVIIAGSSRASHHYVSNMISESMGLSVRNCGLDGCFFSYNCCVIQSILDRYHPQLIIMEIGVEDLAKESEDPMENLYPYYNINHNVTKCINEEYDWTSIAPLYSNLYKYNSLFHRIIHRYVKRNSFKDNGQNGYEPLPQTKWAYEQKQLTHFDELSQTKVNRFKSVIQQAKQSEVNMIVVSSPVFMSDDYCSASEKTIKTICDSLNVEFYNNRRVEGIFENPDCFKDRTHLNNVGAKQYTNWFINNCLKVD